MALLFQLKTANTVSETEFQRGRLRALGGASWWREPGAWLMLWAKVGGGTQGASGQGWQSRGGHVCHLPLLLVF